MDVDRDALAADCTALADPYVDFSNYGGINLMLNANLDCCAWGGARFWSVASAESPDSNVDLATTVVFTDSASICSISARASTARGRSSLWPPPTPTRPSPRVTKIEAAHIQDVRNGVR